MWKKFRANTRFFTALFIIFVVCTLVGFMAGNLSVLAGDTNGPVGIVVFLLTFTWITHLYYVFEETLFRDLDLNERGFFYMNASPTLLKLSFFLRLLFSLFLISILFF